MSVILSHGFRLFPSKQLAMLSDSPDMDNTSGFRLKLARVVDTDLLLKNTSHFPTTLFFNSCYLISISR
jgi:hypothetical protein